jgi:hypothetical protein
MGSFDREVQRACSLWGTDVVLTFFPPREQLVEKPPIPAKNVRHGKAKSPGAEQGGHQSPPPSLLEKKQM